MKIRFLLFIFLLSSLGVKSQEQMMFSYDAAGNRVSRVMVLAKFSAKSSQALSFKSQSLFDEIGGRQVQIYPNSSTGHVIVEMLGKSDAAVKLSVYNASGMQVYSQVMQDERLDIDLSNNPSGIYILTLEVNGERQSWKIVKK